MIRNEDGGMIENTYGRLYEAGMTKLEDVDRSVESHKWRTRWKAAEKTRSLLARAVGPSLRFVDFHVERLSSFCKTKRSPG